MSRLLNFLSDSDNDQEDIKETCINSEISLQHKCPIQNCQLDHKTLLWLLNSEISSNNSVAKAKQTSLINQKDHYKSRPISKGEMHMMKTNSHICDQMKAGTSEPREDNIEISRDYDQLLIKPENVPRIEDRRSKSSYFSEAKLQQYPATPSSPGSSKSSFAFPVLETEWYGSPIRMGGAERKQLPKRQRFRWGECFRCCKF